MSSHAESSAFIYLIYVISACKVSDTAAKLKIHITSWDYLFGDAGRSLDSHGNSISGKTRCCWIIEFVCFFQCCERHKGIQFTSTVLQWKQKSYISNISEPDQRKPKLASLVDTVYFTFYLDFSPGASVLRGFWQRCQPKSHWTAGEEAVSAPASKAA